MKPKNFPKRKRERQLKAKGENLANHEKELDLLRDKRTKKDRRSKAGLFYKKG